MSSRISCKVLPLFSLITPLDEARTPGVVVAEGPTEEFCRARFRGRFRSSIRARLHTGWLRGCPEGKSHRLT